MTKKIVPGRNFNADEYWDSVSLNTGYAVGDKTVSLAVPANSIVKEVIAQVQKSAINADTGAAAFKVGDSADDDGFILEQSLEALAQTVFGNDPDEVGEYLLTFTGGHDPEESIEQRRPHMDQRIGKFYKNESSIIVTSTVSTVALLGEGRVRVWAKILHLLADEV